MLLKNGGEYQAPPGQFLSIAQVASGLPCSVTPSCISRWIHHGVGGHKLRATRVGGRLFIDPRDLEAFVQVVGTD